MVQNNVILSSLERSDKRRIPVRISGSSEFEGPYSDSFEDIAVRKYGNVIQINVSSEWNGYTKSVLLSLSKREALNLIQEIGSCLTQGQEP
jgi:hypothetical protein